MKLQPTSGPNTAHTTAGSRWSLASDTNTTSAPAATAAAPIAISAADEGPRVCGSVVIARSVWSTKLRNALRGLRTYVRI